MENSISKNKNINSTNDIENSNPNNNIIDSKQNSEIKFSNGQKQNDEIKMEIKIMMIMIFLYQ